MRTFVILFIIAFLPEISTGQEVLAYTLEPGQIFKVRQEAKQEITQEMEEDPQQITNTITGVLSFEVAGETEQGFTLIMKFEDLTMRMVSTEHGELLDIKALEVVPDNPQTKIFNSLLNSPVQLLMARNGEVLKVIGGDSLVNRMVHASGIENEFTLDVMKKSLEKEFGSEALSNSYEQLTYFYPNNAISPGDTWVNEYSGKLSATNKWTLERLSEKSAFITGMADIAVDIAEENTIMRLNGRQTTRITTERLSGFIIKMEVESTSKGVTIMDLIAEKEIPTTIKSTITYQLIQ